MIVAAERAALLGAAYRGRYSSLCSAFLQHHGDHDITFLGIKQQKNDPGKWSTERRFTFWKEYGWFQNNGPPMYFLAWDERTVNKLGDADGDAVTRANIHHPFIALLPWMPKDGARQGLWKCKGVISLDHEEALALLTSLQSKETNPSGDVSFKPKQAEFELKITGTIRVKQQHTPHQTPPLSSIYEHLQGAHRDTRQDS